VAAGSASGAGELAGPAAPAPGAEDWRCDAIVQSAGAKLARCRGRSSLGQVLSSHGVRWSTAASDNKRVGGAGWILRGWQGRERGNGEIASRLASPERGCWSCSKKSKLKWITSYSAKATKVASRRWKYDEGL
jgi:hypothetical protein